MFGKEFRTANMTQLISEEQKLMRQGCRAFIDDLVIPCVFLRMDATADISKFKIVRSMFPATAGKYARRE
jgi:hypothetical protein